MLVSQHRLGEDCREHRIASFVTGSHGVAMIREQSGDLLAADVEALVNAVNTVGVMGKGIALQFKQAYPAMFREYARAARAGEVQIGAMRVWATGATSGPRFIINFPTKRHWRSPSSLAHVAAGLPALAQTIEENEIRSVAIPALGCGYGGLDWASVEPLIHQTLAPLSTLVDIQLYPPPA
ncbi:macro domain-containing protein [Nocardia sp. NPDC058640]|uniref:macro domain-containing protein n=1 Tax=Nocardia sp. NPDC058640 TaxID=3346571 RepID=UPI00365822DF